MNAAKDTAAAPLEYQASGADWATARFIAEPPSFIARAFVYLTIVGIASFALYASIAEVAVVVEAPGIIIPREGVVPIRAPGEFTVATVLVAANQEVKAGDPLVVAEEAVSEEDAAHLVEQAETLRALLTRDNDKSCAPCVRELASQAEAAFRSSAQGSLRQRLVELRSRLREYAALRANFDRQGASNADLRRRIKLANQKIRRIRAQKAEKMLAVEMERLEGEVVSARAALAGRRRSGRSELDGHAARLIIALGELEATVAEYKKRTSVIAPIDGIVADFQLGGAGQLVSAGQTLMSIVPKDVLLAAEIRVANQDISKVRPGMPVRLRLEALPDRDFGLLNGTVASVAPSASFDARLTPGGAVGQAQPRASYQVTVELERQGALKDGRAYPFRIGMLLTGLLITGHESMLELALKRLLQIKDDVLPES